MSISDRLDVCRSTSTLGNLRSLDLILNNLRYTTSSFASAAAGVHDGLLLVCYTSIYTSIMSRRITPSLLNTSLPARTVAVSPYLLRAASSATNPTPTASSSHTSPAQLPLTWPAYLSARRQRRLWSTLTSVPTTLVGLFGGGGYFANMELDPGQMILGMDPM